MHPPIRDAAWREALYISTVLNNPWIRQKPHQKQETFLKLIDTQEVLFGGAAAGGKSSALLIGALQFADVPGYAALILRRTQAELRLADALVSRSLEWLWKFEARPGQVAKWNDDNSTWTFPSGAMVTFGYLDKKNDRLRYQSAQFDYIAFDELTHFKEIDYTWMFNRIRKEKNSLIPTRMRAATNPGSEGHSWVKKRFMKEANPDRVFIHATLDDNPSIDADDYRKKLKELDERTRRQLEFGDWTDFEGNHFQTANWPHFAFVENDAYVIRSFEGKRDLILKDDVTILVGVDWASTDKKESDDTAVVAAALLKNGSLLILEATRAKVKMDDGAKFLAKFCRKHAPHVVGCEDDALSKAMTRECRRERDIPEMRVLKIGNRNKLVRANPAICMGEGGRIYLPSEAPWLDFYCDQLVAFDGEKGHADDLVDATSIVCTLAHALKGGSVHQAEDYGVIQLTGGWNDPTVPGPSLPPSGPTGALGYGREKERNEWW
jgi:predicted phage terminase large subunit-like protein